MTTSIEATAEKEKTRADEAAYAAPSVKRAALGNAAWTVAGFSAMQALRFGSNVVLTWLLAPHIFGLMTLVNVFNQGLQMFTDVGIGPSLVQNKRGEERDFRNTAWTVMVLRGFFLWLCSAVIAWPLARLYEEPTLLLLIPAVGAAAAIAGFDSTALYTLRRRLARGRLVVMEVGIYALTMGLTVLWVYYYPTVWALVVSNLFATTLQAVLSHFLIRGYRNGLCWDREAVRELVHFGKWVFLSTVCTFLANQADRLIVGEVSIELLGVYGIAAAIALMPVQLMLTMAWQLVFPLYSRLTQAGHDVRSAFARVHPLAAGSAAFLTAGMVAVGPTLIRCIYDSRYTGAAWMVPFLAIGGWFQMLECLESSVLWALGRARAPAVSNAAKLISLVVLVPAGYWLVGFPGMLLGFVAADLIRYVATMTALRRQGVAVLTYDLVMSLFLVVSSGTAVLAGSLLWPSPAGRLDLLVRGLTEGAVVVLLWAGLTLVCWRRGLFRKPGERA